MITTVFTDASWCPKSKYGGFACWVKSDNGTFKKYGEMSGKFDGAHKAELAAIVNGVWFALKCVPDTTYMICSSDCKTAIDNVNNCGVYSPDKKRMAAHVRWMTRFIRFELRHVKAHVVNGDKRHAVNNWCDEYAKMSMRAKRDRARIN